MATRRIQKGKKYTRKRREVRKYGGVSRSNSITIRKKRSRSRSESRSASREKKQRICDPCEEMPEISDISVTDSPADSEELEEITGEDFEYLRPIQLKGKQYKSLRVKNGFILEGEPVSLCYNTGWGNIVIADAIRTGKTEETDVRFISKNGVRFTRGSLLSVEEPHDTNGKYKAFVIDDLRHDKSGEIAAIRPFHMNYIRYRDCDLDKKQRELHKNRYS